jgi:hypothetical protein
VTGLGPPFREDEAPTDKLDRIPCPACGGSGWLAVGETAEKDFDPRRYGTWVTCEPKHGGLCGGRGSVAPLIAARWKPPEPSTPPTASDR